MSTLRRGTLVAIALTCVFTLAACGPAEEPRGGEVSEDTMSESPMDEMSESPMDDQMSEDEMMSDALGFTAPTAAGDTFEGADLAGSPVVVFFWSEMCDTCADTAAALGDVDGVTRLEDGMGDLASHFGVMADGDVVLIDDEGTVTHHGPMDPMELPDEVASLTM
jgi:hypothetical protein